MSTMAAYSVSSGAGAKASATPRLCAFNSARYYRRSTTNKAPRKRTFLTVMTKFDAALAVPAGVPHTFASNVGMLAGGLCNEPALDMSGGDAGNGQRGNFNNGRGNNGGQGGNFGDGSRIPLFFQAMLGAIALTAAIAAFPAQSQATPSHANTAFGISASRPRAKVMHISCKDSTLVVPLPSNGDVQSTASMRLGPFSRTRIVENPVVLSGREVALLDSSQYRVRESMRI